MKKIELVSYELVYLNIPSEVPTGLCMEGYDCWETGEEFPMGEGYNLYIKKIKVGYVSSKNEDLSDHFIKAHINGRFMVADYFNKGDLDVRNSCVKQLINKLNEIVNNNTRSGDLPKIEINIPPQDSDIYK
jgi:hypothetical protein